MATALDLASRITDAPFRLDRLDRLGRRIEVGAGDLQRYDA